MFILIDVLSWGAHTHTHAYIHVYCSPGTDLGYEVGGWCAVDGSRVLNKKKNQTKKKSLIYYIRYSAVSVLLAVLVLLPKPNHHVVMSHPQRQ